MMNNLVKADNLLFAINDRSKAASLRAVLLSGKASEFTEQYADARLVMLFKKSVNVLDTFVYTSDRTLVYNNRTEYHCLSSIVEKIEKILELKINGCK